MILVNILKEKHPLTRNDTSIYCSGLKIFEGTKDKVSSMWEYYKMFGLPVKVQMEVLNKIKTIENESKLSEITDYWDCSDI